MLQREHPDEYLLALDRAGVKRGDRWLVRGVTFEVRRGEIVTLIGPNGSGKSTSARMALGLLKPDEGDVMTRAGLRVGYVPQKLAIDRTMPLTVERLMTLTGPLTRGEIESALADAGVRHLARAEVQTLSGGEFQRALLARAIARKPDLLVLDEPVQGVDFSGGRALYELISNIRSRSGCGVLLISHDLHVVMAATDTVICMNGYVCCRGTPEAVSRAPEYRALFGGRGAGGPAVCSHNHDEARLPDGRIFHPDDSVDDCHPDDGEHRRHHDRPHGLDRGCGHAHPAPARPKAAGEGVPDAR